MGTAWNLQSQLLVAIQNNNVKQVHNLLDRGLDPDIRFRVGSQKRPAVCLCVERNSIELVQLLLQWGCSVNQSDGSGVTALHIAAGHSNVDMVELLIKSRAHVNTVSTQGQTPLHWASQRPSVAVIKALLEAGAEVDRYDNEQKTPLLGACIHGHAEVADYLITHGADVNIGSPCGNTPLLFVASMPYVNLPLMDKLLKAGANVNRQNRQGESPLHAVLRGQKSNRLSAMDLLLSWDCDVNLCTNLGHTPLHLAAIEHDNASITKLVKVGCAVDPRDDLGLSPLFYLTREGNSDMINLLLNAGAQIHNQKWLNDETMLRSVKDPSLLDWLAWKGKQCPSLSEICRITLRTSWGIATENIIKEVSLPSALKHYILLET